MKATTSNESARAGKAGEHSAKGAANGADGPDQNNEGSQAEILTSGRVASLLKSDLADAEPDPGENETARGEGEGQTGSGRKIPNSKVQHPKKDPNAETPEGEEERTEGNEGNEEESRREAEAEKEKAKATRNPEAEKEAEGVRKLIAGLESKLEEAESAEDKAKIQTEIEGWKTDLAQWEELAGGEAEAEKEIPEALAQAISEWEEKGGGELPAALQGLVEKRIHKLTSARETEKARADQAEARIAELQSEVERLSVERPNGNGAGALLDEKALGRVEGTARRLIEDAENFLDESATEEEAARVRTYMESERLDAKGLKRRVRELQGVVAQIPAERQRIQQFRQAEAQAEPKAKEWFPFLYDKAAPDYAEAQKVLEMMPEIRSRTPAHRFAIGTYILGLRELKRLHPEAFAANGQSGQGGANGTRSANAGKLPRRAPVKGPMSGAGGGAAAPNGARTRARTAEEDAARQQHEKRPTAETAERLAKLALRGGL